MKKILLLILFVSFSTYAQDQHAWVYFTDKADVATSIANPTTILTAEAVARKANHGVVIDERDVPVNETYISGLKSQSGIEVKAKSKWFNCAHVIGTQTDVDALLALPYVDHIIYADRTLNAATRSMTTATTSRTVNKFETLVIYNYGDAANQAEMIKIDKVHEMDYTGEGVVVAVLDAGFTNVNTMTAFQRLRNNGDLLDGYDFVNRTSDVYAYTGNSHGTHVLSDMAAFIDGQFVGTAPDASYYVFRTEDAGSETPVEESYWVEAAERADSLGVDVINTSLGYNRFDDSRYDYLLADMNGDTAFITKGANIAVEKGIVVVNSAGNSGNDATWGTITAPADGNAFTIGAVDGSGNYASFSSRGPTADGRIKPDVVAQGSGVYIVNQFDGVSTSAGTSFSSPVIAGAMACLVQALPDKTNLELMQLVRESASIFSSPTDQLGYGIPNFEMLLLALSQPENVKQEIVMYPNPVTSQLHIISPNSASHATIIIYSLLGERIKTLTISNQNETVDLSFLNAGIYTLQVNSDGNQFTKKIIKQ